MALEIQHREREDVEILDLQGRHTLGPEDIFFREEFQRLLEQGRYRIVLNCKGLDEIDSVGVGTLICSQELLEKSGGKLALTEVREDQMEMLVTLKLEAFFEVFESETEAVNSFFPERHVARVDVLKLVRKFKHEDEEKDKKETETQK
jgi:anti-sigma B factor antagonist